MDKSNLVLLPVIKPVDLYVIKWLIQIYIFVFIKTIRCMGRPVMDRLVSNNLSLFDDDKIYKF